MQLSGPCNIDTDSKGSAAKWFSDGACSIVVPLTKEADLNPTYYGGYGCCARAAAASPLLDWVDRNYQVNCAATPVGSTSGVVVSFAILIAFGACRARALTRCAAPARSPATRSSLARLSP
jgi:hypothetical protein